MARLAPEVGFIYAVQLLERAAGNRGRLTADALEEYAFALEAIYVTHQKALARALREYAEKRSDELYGRLLAAKKRAGRKWKGVQVGSKLYPVHFFDPKNASYMPKVAQRYLETLARERAYDEIRGHLQDELIEKLDQMQPGLGERLNAYSESQLLEMVGVTDPLMRALLADGEKAQREAMSAEALRESAREAAQVFDRIQTTLKNSDALQGAVRAAERQKRQHADALETLGSILAMDTQHHGWASKAPTSNKVEFSGGMCSAYAKGNVQPEDGGPVRALIYLTLDRELFDDFVVFYEHDVPRAYGFDRDPRAATAAAKASGKSLSRAQYNVLEQYRLKDKPIPRVADVKRKDGSFDKGVATKLADRIEYLSVRADSERTKNARNRRKAQDELRKFFRAFGSKPTLDQLQEVFRKQFRTRFIRKGTDGKFLVSDGTVLEVLTGSDMGGRRATLVERQQAARKHGDKVFEEAVYGEEDEYNTRSGIYRALPLVFKAPLFIAQASKGPTGTAKVMKLASAFGIVDMDTADPARYFLDADPHTEEGEDTARLAQSIYCAGLKGDDVEMTLTPAAAQHFANALKRYKEYPLAVDLTGGRGENDPVALARLSKEAASTRTALIRALNDVFGKEGCYD